MGGTLGGKKEARSWEGLTRKPHKNMHRIGCKDRRYLRGSYLMKVSLTCLCSLSRKEPWPLKKNMCLDLFRIKPRVHSSANHLNSPQKYKISKIPLEGTRRILENERKIRPLVFVLTQYLKRIWDRIQTGSNIKIPGSAPWLSAYPSSKCLWNPSRALLKT